MRLTVGNGINEYITELNNLWEEAPATVSVAIYKGAKIVTDEIKKNINKIPVDNRPYSQKVTGLKSVQIEGLRRSLGIAKKSNDNGYINVKAGFDGYNKIGQPNAMIARTIEGGNSFTQKHPFVAPAIRETRDKAEQEMARVVNERIAKVMT